MKRTIYFAFFAVLLSTFFFLRTSAQRYDEKLAATILFKDSLFWNAYNTCDVNAASEFFSDDVEFYHDKGGITFGLAALTTNMKNNLCGNAGFRLRREVVEGTVKIFPLKKSDTIYGAILSGEHLFYINETGKTERLDGHASFTHVWLLKNGEWKMTRVLSYDHHPAEYINKRKEIALDESQLKQFTGNYKSPNFGEIRVAIENKKLVLQASNQNFILYPETENRFFSKERDLTFEFVTKENKMDRFIVRENGNIVEEVIFVNK